jgi:hypothetical protein
MAAHLSVRTRALLAVALLVGFYTLAIGIALGLLYIPYAEEHYLNHLTGRLAIFCVVGAFVIVRAIIPRRDKFEPPGPHLLPADPRSCSS